MAQKDSIEQNYKLRELGDFKGATGGSKHSYCGCVKDAAMPRQLQTTVCRPPSKSGLPAMFAIMKHSPVQTLNSLKYSGDICVLQL